jgi:hypothetical protein
VCFRRIRVSACWGATRVNSAINVFTKASSLLQKGLDKMKRGEDPSDDFISAGASIGQAVNEGTFGAATDLGNHASKMHQNGTRPAPAPEQRSPQPRSSEPTPQATPGGSADYAEGSTGQAPVQTEAGTGTPIPASSFKSDDDAHFAQLPPTSSDERLRQIQDSQQLYAKALNQQIDIEQKRLMQGMEDKLAQTHEEARPTVLNKMADASARELETARKLATAMKAENVEMGTKTATRLDKLRTQLQSVREQLKSERYVDPEVAGLSHADAAERLGAKLLSYRREEEATSQALDIVTKQGGSQLGATMTALRGKMAAVEALPEAERAATMETWLDRYGNAVREISELHLGANRTVARVAEDFEAAQGADHAVCGRHAVLVSRPWRAG